MRRAAAWTVAAAALVLAATPAAAAQEPTAREIIESQQRLEQIRRERAQLRDEMTRIRSRVSDLSAEVTNLSRQVGSSANLLEELEFQLASRTAQIEANTSELLSSRDQLAERRAVLQIRLRDIYKRGPLQTLQVLLTAESFSDLINRYRYLFLVARHDRRLAQEVASLEEELVARERSLRASLGTLEAIRFERTWEHDQLAALQEQQRQALVGVETRERTTAQRIRQLEEAEASLTDMLAAIEVRRREAEAGSAGTPATAPTVPTLGPASMGALAWPVEGRLLYGFGRQTQPNGTVVRWNGVGIGAAAGAEVRAVEGGLVVLAGPFEGYGPTVVLSHGGGYYTLYLYLREVNVREGISVRRGQRLGTVGGESTSEGPHLEFQIRTPGGQAVDPLAWLQRR